MLSIFITLGLFYNSLTHHLIQTWPLKWIWVWQGVRACHLRRTRCCLLRADRHTKPVGRARRAELRWRGGEKFHRSADGQENLTANCWHQQHLIMDWASVRPCPKGLTVRDSRSTSARANRLDCSDTWWQPVCSCADSNFKHWDIQP